MREPRGVLKKSGGQRGLWLGCGGLRLNHPRQQRAAVARGQRNPHAHGAALGDLHGLAFHIAHLLQAHRSVAAGVHDLDQIAHGEVVVVNDKFGIRMTDVISPSERIKKLR